MSDPLDVVRRSLAPEPRVAAIVQAEARGDHAEAVRLAAAAPPDAFPSECPRCVADRALAARLTPDALRALTLELVDATTAELRALADEREAQARDPVAAAHAEDRPPHA